MDRKGQQQVHVSGFSLPRHGKERTHSPGREEVYRLFGKQRSVLPQTVPIGMVSDCKSAFASDPLCSAEGKNSSIAERRKEGRYKTFDWAEFSHMKKKRETLGRQSRTESESVQKDSVPPVPAPSPEELTKLYTSPPCSSAPFSSLSVQTECQWDLELQTLCAELKATNERSKKEGKKYKLSEAHLQAKLKDSQDCLLETESTLRQTLATLRKRENALEELQRCLEDVSGRLKATEEAQALKDVRIQRRLRLLEESQERERKSLSDSLEHAEKRGKNLEERLRQTEAMLLKMPTVSMVEQLERKCQELQNQLDESDSELSRLQTRLRNEETLYYDLEHNYEQLREELELVRGALENCERICEERCKIQLEQQQEKLNRKEQELQKVFLKIGCLGTTSGRSGILQRHVFKLHPMESQMNEENLGNLALRDLGKKTVSTGDESEVISVIQALESKLCDTEERLHEITVHLQQQQQKHENKVNTCKDGDHWCLQKTNTSLGMSTRDKSLNGKNCGVILKKTKANLATSEMFKFDLQEALQDKSPDEIFCQRMTNRMLSLEALVIRRMAAVLEHPTKHFLDGLSELKSQTKAFREVNDEGPITKNYSQLFLYFQEIGEEGCSLNECEIFSLCMNAELAYLTYTNHLHKPGSEQGSHASNVPFRLGSEVKPPNIKKETSSESDFSLPEPVPHKNQTHVENLEYSQENLDKDSLVVELQTQARSLQALSRKLYPLDETAISPSELSPVILQTILFQAVLAYVTCKLHVAMQWQVCLLGDQREQASCQRRRLEAMLQEQTEHYKEKQREDRVVIEVAELARVSAETDAQIKKEELQKLEAEFKKNLQEHQQIHEEEMTRLHEYYTQTVTTSESSNGEHSELSVATMKERICELELHIRSLEDECRRGDANNLRQAYEQELETLKVTCELGFSSMEQSHQRVIEEMQRQHQIEVEQLLEERDRVLQEETNATIAAIGAMHKAHKEELEKTQNVQQNGANTDMSKLRTQFKDALDSLHRELEVLSEQYSQKCLENAHLSRTIETERQALNSVERENQELHTRNQVALRVKEAEIQCLKQEISSLKEELQAANRQCKKLLNELSRSGVRCPTTNAETCRNRNQSYDVMKSRSNPDLTKNRMKPKPPIRSKVRILENYWSK
ncbi:Myosin phosphatase Rho-interacting protein [Bagarius yarrelli]|uniref:Myosin phosphatase Rho-interacting protein n=1 Tax=Bagarius yarrelli TaxID=175774 RepID=A0A556VCK4_BAGYA|nr:Myosin phosphatase Rho-interacting protein [Bagarius yarrelli]